MNKTPQVPLKNLKSMGYYFFHIYLLKKEIISEENKKILTIQ